MTSFLRFIKCMTIPYYLSTMFINQQYLLHGTFITMLKKQIQMKWLSVLYGEPQKRVLCSLVPCQDHILLEVNEVFHGGRISVQCEGGKHAMMLVEMNSGMEPKTE